jgi:hypothetical protein
LTLFIEKLIEKHGGAGHPRKTSGYHTAKLAELGCEEITVLLAQSDGKRMRLVSSKIFSISRNDATVALMGSSASMLKQKIDIVEASFMVVVASQTLMIATLK